MDIPKQVLQAFSTMIRYYGDYVEYIGEVDGAKYYRYNNPQKDDTDTGLPMIVGFARGRAFNVVGLDSLKILRLIYPKD